jgi:hypothetical protein
MIFEILSSNFVGLALALVVAFAVCFYVGLFALALIGKNLDNFLTSLVGAIVIVVGIVIWSLFFR